jgi:hypothetical protein
VATGSNGIVGNPGTGWEPVGGPVGAGQGSVIGSATGYAADRGAVRIIWGTNRAFPSTNTGDL